MILVTGSQGFIGKHLTKKLDEIGLEYVEYDLNYGGDIRDEVKLNRFFSCIPIDTIIHLAAVTRADESQIEKFISTNITGTEILLNLAKKYDVKRIIAFSSSAVYGDQLGPLSETTPVNPISLYGVTKVAMEMLCRKSGIPTIIVRPFSVYGENNTNDHIINIWLDRIKYTEPIPFFGGDNIKRGYTYVGDVVDGIIKILSLRAVLKFDIFNMAGRGFITSLKLLKIFRSVYPQLDVSYLPIPATCPYENWANTDKAKIKLGWEPRTDFGKKVREIIT